MNVVVHRVSPQQARYTPAGGREKCSFCRFYIAPKWCGHVTGPVSPSGWCKYFSQEMRRQFGGSIVTSGIPSGATLSLDFMSSGNMPAGITFTRASTATYTDASGTIQTAAINVPRWDYANGVSRGLLIEEQHTNLALNSGNLAAWGVGSGVVAAPTVTANNAVAPDGTTTAARIVYPAVSGANANSTVQQYINATANPFAFSVWMKGSVGGEQVWLNTNVLPTWYRTLVTLTTQWQRFTLLTSALTAAGWWFQIGTDLRDAGQSSTPAQTIYAWGAQVEQGALTSYIPTTAATVTRSQDSCAISSANMAPWFLTTSGSWFAEFVSFLTNPQNPRVIGENTNVGGCKALVGLTSGTTFNASEWDQANAVSTANLAAANAVMKCVSSWAASNAKICLNAGPVATSNGVMTNGFASLATNGVKLMTVNTSASSTDNMSGYFRRVQYWPRVLTDAEMQQVTT